MEINDNELKLFNETFSELDDKQKVTLYWWSKNHEYGFLKYKYSLTEKDFLVFKEYDIHEFKDLKVEKFSFEEFRKFLFVFMIKFYNELFSKNEKVKNYIFELPEEKLEKYNEIYNISDKIYFELIKQKRIEGSLT